MIVLLGALGGALTLLAIGETYIAGNYRINSAAIYAADAAIEIATNHLVTVPDWTLVHAGTVVSTFIDGAPAGARNTAAGAIDPAVATIEVRSAPNGRPWQLYAYGRLHALAAQQPTDADIYVVVWIASHPAGASADTAIVLAHAYGAYGVRRAVEATVARTSLSGVRVTAWREVH
jgi:hypothetical protein